MMGYLPRKNMPSKMKKSQISCQSVIVEPIYTKPPIRKYSSGFEQ